MDQRPKQWGQEGPFNFSKKGVEPLITHKGKMKLDYFLKSSNKISSEWIEGTSMKNKATKLSRDNTGNYFYDLWFEKKFLIMKGQTG